MEPDKNHEHPHRPGSLPRAPLSVESVVVELEESRARSRGADGYHHSSVDNIEHSHRVSIESAPGTGRRLAFIAGILFLLLVIGFLVSFILRMHHHAQVTTQTMAMADAPPEVVVVSVVPAPAEYPLSLPGQTAGWYQSVIYSRVDGFVGDWTADIGDRVKKGQSLATIETPELDQQLNAAKAKVQASAAQETVAGTDVSIAKITYDRWWDSPKGVVSEQERQEKKATYESAQAKLIAAKAQTQLDQAEVDRLTAIESFKKVVAPYDGVITARHIDFGSLVTAGSTASTSPLYDISQSNTIRVYVDVPQKVAAEMKDGLTAQVTSNQFPGRVFEGKIARSAMAIDPQSRTQKTEVDIPNPDLLLVPNMYVEVTIQLKQSGLFQVPASALLFQPSGIAVAIVDGDDKIQFHPTTIAKDNGPTVELSQGVRAGDRVALNLSSEVSVGQKVDPVESSAAGTPKGQKE